MPINKGIPGGAPSARKQALQTYRLDDQVGFLLRQAFQRNVALFSQAIEKFTVTQWAALAKLHELGECSQNSLGRATAMDTATIRGVVSRLKEKGFVELHEYPDDRRRVLIRLTDGGRSLSEILCVRHSMSIRSMNATQDQNNRIGGPSGTAADST